MKVKEQLTTPVFDPFVAFFICSCVFINNRLSDHPAGKRKIKF